MDPISITAAVGQGARLAWTAGKALFDLIEDTKLVDESVKALASEATQLGNTCDSVSKHLKELSALRVDADDVQLFSSIQMQLSGCDRSLRKLTGAIDSVRKRRTNVLAQTARQIELNLKQETILESRTQIRAHIANLQISLQLVTLKATFLAPRLANQDLLKQMSQLQTAIVDQGQRIDAALLQCAKGYLSSGSTLYEDSIAGGSVIGFSETQQQNLHIAEWISSLNALRIDSADVRDVQPAPATLDGFPYEANTGPGADAPMLGHDASFRSASRHAGGYDNADSESNDFALEMAMAAKRNGDIAFHKLDYAKAEVMLKEALSLLQELPLRTRPTHIITSIHYKLAACAFHLHDASTAESALLTVVEQSPSNNEEALALCQAAHLLAMVWTGMDKLGPARSTCNNAYRTRRKILGKDHKQCYQSLALLSVICGRQQEPTRSEIYLSTIPKEHRSRTVDRIETLLKQRYAQGSRDDLAGFNQGKNSPQASASRKLPRGSGVGDSSQLADDFGPQDTLTSVQAEVSWSHCLGKPSVARAFISYEGLGGGSVALRSMKNKTQGFSDVQIKVRNATANSESYPSEDQMAEISKITYNSLDDYWEVINMLHKRLNDKGKHWRHVLKSLEVLEHCLRCGSERTVMWATKNVSILKALREFAYLDEWGQDVGAWSKIRTNATSSSGYITLALQVVRNASKALMLLVLDKDELRAKRASSSDEWTSVVSGRKVTSFPNELERKAVRLIKMLQMHGIRRGLVGPSS